MFVCFFYGTACSPLTRTNTHTHTSFGIVIDALLFCLIAFCSHPLPLFSTRSNGN